MAQIFTFHVRLLSTWRAECELALVEAEMLGGGLGGMIQAPAQEPR